MMVVIITATHFVGWAVDAVLATEPVQRIQYNPSRIAAVDSDRAFFAHSGPGEPLFQAALLRVESEFSP